MTTAATKTTKADPLAPFSAPVRRWFEASFEGPTPAQIGGWEAISGGDNALICAPTGSGKTLASFLWGIDKLAREPDLGTGVRLVYVSPLKALSYDIERNLRAPLRGIGAEISVGLRTGDTSQAERRAMRKTPPDILITTPESLYLMLSSGVREILATDRGGDRRRDPRGGAIQAGGASGVDARAVGRPGQSNRSGPTMRWGRGGGSPSQKRGGSVSLPASRTRAGR